MAFANIIGIICVVVTVSAALYSLLCIIKFFLLFYMRHCKKCNHLMEFKGYEEEDGVVYYKFHCEHCGIWEKLTRSEIIPDNAPSTEEI